MNSDPPPPSTRRAPERPTEGIRGLKDLSDFSLQDVDAVRLILRGDSVIDWHRLNITDRQQATEFIRNHELDPDDEQDAVYITALKEQAIGYLRRNFSLAFPKPVQNARAEELVASGARVGVLASEIPEGLPSEVERFELSRDLEGVARELYARLREVDRRGVDVLLVVPPAEVGVGRAIVDRLRRAAAPRLQG